MISHLADPRSPGDVARQMLRRADALGDADMRRRGLELLRYSRDLEERGLGAEPDVVEHVRYEPRRPSDGSCYRVGFALSFFATQVYFGSLLLGVWTTLVSSAVLVSCVLGLTLAVRAVRETRQ